MGEGWRMDKGTISAYAELEVSLPAMQTLPLADVKYHSEKQKAIIFLI